MPPADEHHHGLPYLAVTPDGGPRNSLSNSTPPPPYGELPDQLQFHQPGIEAGANVTDDGRVNININQTNARFSEFLASSLKPQLSATRPTSLPPAYIPPSLGGQPGQTPPPKLNVVVQIVGSRGDVQPFVALGQVLRDTYGHRVRIATHATFQQFVEENGLEFFCIGGDPAELMAFMVKNPGLMPDLDTLKSGEIGKRRKGIQTILAGCWRSCVEPGNGLGPALSPHDRDATLDTTNLPPGDPNDKPFIADVIIANPPSFAHIHIAEKLGIPLHLMFTMPWSPTKSFPHPLANIQSSNTDDVMTNYISYALVEMMTWQGLGDVINVFREKALDLEPLSPIWAPGLLTRLRIPYTYCWSPSLIPKPNDWTSHIDISGFFFLNLASSFTPDPDLASFLAAGPPPVYIGFGSIVVDEPDRMTRLIFDAIHISGVRALVSKGWGGLGADAVGLPEGVFMLGNVPHDWLFQHVSCVVHHGGAGTTAAGIKAGRPTVVVPFFGDQPFWGAMVARAGAGPDPIPHKRLTAENLAEAIKFAILPETVARAEDLGRQIQEEKGADHGGQSFHDHLDLDSMRCSVSKNRVAVWRVRRTQVKLSAMAASILVQRKFITYSDLKLYRSKEYNTDGQPWDPITAVTSCLIQDITAIAMAIGDIPMDFRKPSSSKKMPKNDQSPLQSTTELGSQLTSQLSLPTTESGSAISSVEPGASSSLAASSSPGASAVELPGSTPERSQRTAPSRSLSSISTALESSPSTQTVDTPISSIPRSPAPPTPRAQSPLDEPYDTYDNLRAGIETGKGVSRVIYHGVRTPMNFCLGLARGFRNVPLLYNDDMVRPPEKVTDLTSGIKVAGKEFGLGFYDGLAGLVMQPIRGAEKDGGVGLVKGVGKGIGGLIMKPAAGLWGLPAYTMQGAYMSLRHAFGKSLDNYIITSRIHQGDSEREAATYEERHDVILRWHSHKYELKNFFSLKLKEAKDVKGKEVMDETPQSRSALLGQRTSSSSSHRSGIFGAKRRDTVPKGYIQLPVHQQPQSTEDDGNTAEHEVFAAEELERAIRISVKETSRGDTEEDARVEQAIRASIQHMEQNASFPGFQTADGTDVNANLDITDEEYQKLIQKATQESMELHQKEMERDAWRLHDQDNDEELQNAIALSKRDSQLQEAAENDSHEARLQLALEQSKMHHNPQDDDFLRAIEESKASLEDDEVRRSAAKREEDIVLEYTKKQSLEEEAYRRVMGTRRRQEGGTTSEEDDEELRLALLESLTMGDGAGPSGLPSEYPPRRS